MRRSLFATVLFIAFVFPVCGGQGSPKGAIQWKNYEEGMRIVRSEKKPAVKRPSKMCT